MTTEPPALVSMDADTLAVLFDSDPLTLSDAQLDALISELRRRRSAFLSEEAAKAAKGKSARTEAEAQPNAAAPVLDKPTSEIDLDDLL